MQLPSSSRPTSCPTSLSLSVLFAWPVLPLLSLLPLLSITLTALAAPAMGQTRWIIDTHTHFKGKEQIAHERKSTPRSPQDTLGQVVVVEDYRKVADRLGIRSTLIVEAVQQDRPDFNDWVIEQAKSDLACGYVARGNLRSPKFAARYKRYQATGLLKGFRFRFEELADYLADPQASKHLSQLEQDKMAIDLLIEPSHIKSVETAAKRRPKLKFVINHCFRARMKNGKIDKDWTDAVQRAARFPNVYCKLSSITNFSDTPPFTKPAPTDLSYYQEVLETCYQAYGEDRLIFGTNWGVCTHFGSVDDVVRLAHEFLKPKGETVVQKVMAKNAIRIYRIQESDLRK